MLRIYKSVFIKIIVLRVFPSFLFAQEKDTVAVRFSKLITAEGMSKNLNVLASDEFEGRETGKKGQKMAAEYISNQFEDAGILPYKEKTYYQEFPLNVVKPMPADVTINEKQYEVYNDFFSFPPDLPQQKLNISNVMFLGYGTDDEKYSDYKGVNVKDKVVMILMGEPYDKDSISFITGKKTEMEWWYNHKAKLEKAKAKGARALLIINDALEKDAQKNKAKSEKESMKLKMDLSEMPVVYISMRMANDILKKQTIQKLTEKISLTGKPVRYTAKTQLVIDIKNRVEKINSENVLGYIEGSDLKNELIIVTAHYDHLGKDGEKIYNGADDDGSGTVAVIDLAKTFAEAKKQGHGTRRSMLFMTVAGEEKGLLGSSYYVQHPEFPLANTVCDLNMDMIGRQDEKHKDNPNYIYLIGSDKLSSQLHTISENANKTYANLELDYTYNDEKDKNRFYYRSDHYNFAKIGIPVIFYFNGVHADYHRETDEVEKINFDKMEKISRLVFFTAWELANRDERIKVDSDKK